MLIVAIILALIVWLYPRSLLYTLCGLVLLAMLLIFPWYAWLVGAAVFGFHAWIDGPYAARRP